MVAFLVLVMRYALGVDAERAGELVAGRGCVVEFVDW